MAIKKNFEVEFEYKNGLLDLADVYSGVLSEEDLQEISTPVLKKYTVKDAYHRVEEMQVTKKIIVFNLSFYSSDAKNKFKSISLEFEPDTSEGALNYHTQAYDYVKSLPEFKGAIDC